MFVLERFKEDTIGKEIIAKYKNIHTSIVSVIRTMTTFYYVLFRRTEALELSIENMKVNYERRSNHLRDELNFLQQINEKWISQKRSRNIPIVDNDSSTKIDAIRVILDDIDKLPDAPIPDPPKIEVPDIKMSESDLKLFDDALDEAADKAKEDIARKEQALQKAQDNLEKQQKLKQEADRKKEELKKELAKAEAELKEQLQTLRDLSNSGYGGDYSKIKEEYEKDANKSAGDLVKEGLKKTVGLGTAGTTAITGATQTTTNTAADLVMQIFDQGGSGSTSIINQIKNILGGADFDPQILKDLGKGIGKGIIVSVIQNTATSYADKKTAERNMQDVEAAYEATYNYLKDHPGDTAGAQKAADDAIVELHRQRDVEANTRAGTPGLTRDSDKLREEAASDLNPKKESAIGFIWNTIKGKRDPNEDMNVYNEIVDQIVGSAQTQIDIENAAAGIQAAQERIDKLTRDLKNQEDKIDQINTNVRQAEREYNNIEQQAVNSTVDSVADKLRDQGLTPPDPPEHYDSNPHPGSAGAGASEEAAAAAQKKWDQMREKYKQYGMDPGEMPEDFY